MCFCTVLSSFFLLSAFDNPSTRAANEWLGYCWICPSLGRVYRFVDGDNMDTDYDLINMSDISGAYGLEIDPFVQKSKMKEKMSKMVKRQRIDKATGRVMHIENSSETYLMKYCRSDKHHRTVQFMLHDLQWGSEMTSGANEEMSERHHPLRVKDDLGRNCLHLAVLHGAVTNVKTILKEANIALTRGSVHLDRRDKNGYTPLHWAVIAHRGGVVSELSKSAEGHGGNGGGGDEKPSSAGSDGAMVEELVGNGEEMALTMLRLLIKAGLDPTKVTGQRVTFNEPLFEGEGRRTIFHFAILYRMRHVTQFLINDVEGVAAQAAGRPKGGLSSRSGGGGGAGHAQGGLRRAGSVANMGSAKDRRRGSMATTLAGSTNERSTSANSGGGGGDFSAQVQSYISDADRNGITPISLACRQAFSKAGSTFLRFLLDDTTCVQVSDVSAQDYTRQNTSLHWLLLNADDATILHFMNHPEVHWVTCVNKEDYCMRTPLHTLTMRATENIEIASLLLQKKASVRHCDRRQNTVLHIAAMCGHSRLATVLVQEYANVKAVNKRGRTPLHYAVENGSVEIVHLLLNGGADPNIADNNGETTTSIAFNNETLLDNTLKNVRLINFFTKKLLINHRQIVASTAMKIKQTALNQVSINRLVEASSSQSLGLPAKSFGNNGRRKIQLKPWAGPDDDASTLSVSTDGNYDASHLSLDMANFTSYHRETPGRSSRTIDQKGGGGKMTVIPRRNSNASVGSAWEDITDGDDGEYDDSFDHPWELEEEDKLGGEEQRVSLHVGTPFSRKGLSPWEDLDSKSIEADPRIRASSSPLARSGSMMVPHTASPFRRTRPHSRGSLTTTIYVDPGDTPDLQSDEDSVESESEYTSESPHASERRRPIGGVSSLEGLSAAVAGRSPSGSSMQRQRGSGSLRGESPRRGMRRVSSLRRGSTSGSSLPGLRQGSVATRTGGASVEMINLGPEARALVSAKLKQTQNRRRNSSLRGPKPPSMMQSPKRDKSMGPHDIEVDVALGEGVAHIVAHSATPQFFIDPSTRRRRSLDIAAGQDPADVESEEEESQDRDHAMLRAGGSIAGRRRSSISTSSVQSPHARGSLPRSPHSGTNWVDDPDGDTTPRQQHRGRAGSALAHRTSVRISYATARAVRGSLLIGNDDFDDGHDDADVAFRIFDLESRRETAKHAEIILLFFERYRCQVLTNRFRSRRLVDDTSSTSGVSQRASDDGSGPWNGAPSEAARSESTPSFGHGGAFSGYGGKEQQATDLEEDLVDVERRRDTASEIVDILIENEGHVDKVMVTQSLEDLDEARARRATPDTIAAAIIGVLSRVIDAACCCKLRQSKHMKKEGKLAGGVDGNGRRKSIWAQRLMESGEGAEVEGEGDGEGEDEIGFQGGASAQAWRQKKRHDPERMLCGPSGFTFEGSQLSIYLKWFIRWFLSALVDKYKKHRNFWETLCSTGKGRREELPYDARTYFAKNYYKMRDLAVDEGSKARIFSKRRVQDSVNQIWKEEVKPEKVAKRMWYLVYFVLLVGVAIWDFGDYEARLSIMNKHVRNSVLRDDDDRLMWKRRMWDEVDQYDDFWAWSRGPLMALLYSGAEGKAPYWTNDVLDLVPAPGKYVCNIFYFFRLDFISKITKFSTLFNANK